MTYLTQAIISHNVAAMRGLRDSYDWHQAVWKAFPGHDGEHRDFLTRLDERDEGFRLLIVSRDKPACPEWCPEETWQTKPIPETYFGKRRYAFQLLANPTRKVTKLGPDGQPTKNGKRVPLRTREEYVAWMDRKAEQGGFVVDSEALRTIQQGRDTFQKKGAHGTHTAVEFQGVLSVSDPTQFHDVFTRGIGSAKAFGFGMLVIAPIA
jgi:CRISPR system Cascade subunit CasE